MGFARRVVRKTVRKATPRPVRQAMHPARTIKYAVTPRPVRQASRAVYTITNPLGAAENKLIGAALNAGGGHRRSASPAARLNLPAGTSASGTGLRAAEAVVSQDQIAALMAVQRQRFTPVQRPVIPVPGPVDALALEQQKWARRKGEARFWQRAKRAQIRAEVRHDARHAAAELTARAGVEQQRQQADVDVWWNALNDGDPGVLTVALQAAFADNPAPVVVLQAGGPDAALVVILPGPEVLPEKRPNVTPTGRLSSKAWSKTELNEVYAQLLGVHLLATIRETWAVAPSVRHVRIVGVRANAQGRLDALFDVDLHRADGLWNEDGWGDAILKHAACGLNRMGKAQEVCAWPTQQLRPEVVSLLS